ncbi:MAG TPA: HAD family hydrolase, partial [Bacteroidetes bacterium]|nr:HAD family hydrolase [Bacteroidota bacterium]
ADVMEAHQAWIAPNVDLCFTPTENCYNIMAKKGMPKDKMNICGFPIHKKYLKKITQKQARTRLGLRNTFTVTFALGGMGAKPVYDYVPALAIEMPDININVICGKNKKMKERLCKLTEKFDNVIIRGYVDNMQDYYAASDLMAIKSGFSTVGECIFTKTPAIVIYAMANEKTAAEYIVKKDIGWWVKNKYEFVKTVKDSRKNKELINKKRTNLAKTDFKYSTTAIVSEIKKRLKLRKRTEWILFDLADTICRLEINNSNWRRVNLEGIKNVMDYMELKHYTNQDINDLAEAFVNKKEVLRTRAKKTLKEFPLQSQLSKFIKSVNIKPEFIKEYKKRWFEGPNLRKDKLKHLEYTFIQPELSLSKRLKDDISTIKDLSKKYNLALISNNVSATLVEEILKKHKMLGYFSEVITSENVGFRKPHKKFLEYSLRKINTAQDKCIIVGDRLNQDILMANNAFITSIQMGLKEHSDNKNAKNIKPNYKITELSELKKIMS